MVLLDLAVIKFMILALTFWFMEHLGKYKCVQMQPVNTVKV